MTEPTSNVTRRRFLETTITAAGVAAVGHTVPTAWALPHLGSFAARPAAKYTRYNVMSPGGQQALASYAKGIQAMLDLPATDPRNWFRNAFVHLMDCPHGNWWFYVWHRAYIGYFEQAIRSLSGDPTFALPYWDWTTQPHIPDAMFNGVLTPSDAAFKKYTRNLHVFSRQLSPAMAEYWRLLSPAQQAQLATRNYTTFDLMWNDVTGFDPHVGKKGSGITGNVAYANPSGARYLTRDNPELDEWTAFDVSPWIVYPGLLPALFNTPNPLLSFTSAKTDSHVTQPAGKDVFSLLEGLPHNKVHNYIGGVGPLDPGPYGFMTNFLSPSDPIFFLHHANMDRLWDVWTRKQKANGLPWLPGGPDLAAFSNEAFLFYVNADGTFVGPTTAGQFVNTDRFEYDYEPGFGEDIVHPPNLVAMATSAPTRLPAPTLANTASVVIPAAAVQRHVNATAAPSLFAEITIQRPASSDSTREFDVVVGGPAGTTRIAADSPYYAGTIAFFGNMSHMSPNPRDATFVVPLPRSRQAFPTALAAIATTIRVVPANGRGESAPVLRSVTIMSR